MSLAQLFYLKETFREHVRRWRHACLWRRAQSSARRTPALSTVEGQLFTLEALEPRLLLSSTPIETNLTTGPVALAAGSVTALATPQATLDIDLNGQTDALSDSTLITRYLFGFTGTTLTTGAVDPAGQRTDPAAIVSYLDSIRPSLDVDLNGQADALTDGVLITRHLFGFTGTTLTAGAVDPAGQRTDPAAIATYLDTLMADRDTTPPVVTAALQQDTGASATDTITNNPTITGTITDLNAIVSFTAGLDSTPVANYTDVLFTRQPDGTFALSTTVMNQLAGGTLADGAHTLHLRASDAQGNVTTLDRTFTLDRQVPGLTGLGLSAGSDTGTVGDLITSASRVVITGLTQVGATVTFGTTTVVASGTGAFQIPDVALASGANTLSLTATDLAGNSSQMSLTVTRTGVATSDVALTWNQLALDAIRLSVSDPPIASRILAMVSLAQYDTLAAIENTAAYLVQQTVNGPVSLEIALAKAAHTVLSELFPAQRASFDAALNALLASVADGVGKTNALALGLSVGQAVLAIRANDGSSEFVDYPGSTAVGSWRPTAPTFEVADEPQWGAVTPFALNSGNQFRPAAPPTLDSAAYATSVKEVKNLGSATSTTRTTDQTQQAQFWADGAGSYTPAGHWNLIAQDVARSEGNSLSANVRLFAKLNVALADSGIAAWDAKYTYGLWRPIDAIHDAELDNNAATTEDNAWTPLLITPSHPEYVSGHSTYSAAAAAILADTFGNSTAFNTTAVTLPDVTRSFTSFTQAAQEAGRSRVYGGIHYEFTNQVGQTLGAQVAGAVLARFALTSDTQAPTIVLTEMPAATNANITVNGQVLDNLSGVASVQYKIDSGALQTLALGTDGSFTLTTTFTTDGTADGVHTITIIASDAAGNISTGVTRSVTLDTKAPTLSLTSFANGDRLTAASRLTGTADATGTTLTQLSYRIDGGVSRSLVFNTTTGAFDEPLPFGHLDVGNHTLVLMATDAAGNLATLTRTVTVDALAPLTITALTPTDGSGDVGVTVRPEIRFSRAVNVATLTADSFYATGPDGSKLAATIVPSKDGTYAWLFFTNPMPGGSQITLNVDGSKIRGATDGGFLDADGNGSSGGTLTQRFTTVSRTSIPGTTLVGKVVDPGPDLEPMTFDDIRRGPDGVIHTPDDVFQLPIAHAKVYILGQEDRFVFTDANGNFELTNVPVGTVKVAVDGRTATNAPSGVFFPEMVIDVKLRPGVTNTVMGGMGSTAEQLANLERQEVYLPRLQSAILQTISNTQPTILTASNLSAPDLTDEQRQALSITVSPGSAVDEQGNLIANPQIGFSTVPPELVRDMLPPGLTQLSATLTIQAPGVARFTEPLVLSFPNLYGAEPGSKLSVYSFDHTTGRLVITGTATVSPDGQFAVTDPDSGITFPGWYGVTPPGAPIQGPEDPQEPPCEEDTDGNPLDKFTFWSDTLSDILACAKQFSSVLNTFNIVYTIINDSLGLVSEIIDFIQTAKRAVENNASAEVVLGLAKVAQTYKDRLVTIVELATEAVDNTAGIWLKIVECMGPALAIADRVCDDLASDPCEEISTFGAFACAAVDTAKRGFDAAQLAYDRFKGDLKSFVSLKAACFVTENTIELLDNYIAQIRQNTPPGPTPTPVPATSVALDQNGALLNTSATDIATLVTVADFEPLVQQLRALHTDLDAGNAEFVVLNSDLTRTVGETTHSTDKLFAPSARLSTSLNGLPENGYYIVRVDNNEFRGRLSSEGKLDFFVAANTEFTVLTFDPSTNLIGAAYGRSPSSGVAVTLPGFLQYRESADADGDGLSDVAEVIVGSNSNKRDTDGDGLSDESEVQQGLDPLGGLNIPAGVVASSELQGSAESVTTIGATDGTGAATALVATGTTGLTIVNASSFTKPQVLAELDLPGTNVDVAADVVRGIAAVAASDAGLHLVDISNLSTPRLLQTVTVDGSVTGVVVRDGIGYAIHGTRISAVDLNTGDIRQTIDFASTGGSTLTDIAIDGSTLYTKDSNGTLRTISITGDLLTPRDALTVANAGGKIFAGGGTVYIGAGNGFQQGFSTVDARDPANLLLLSNPDAANIAGGAIAANGSGLGVAIGSLPGIGSVLHVVDTSDPTRTDRFITQINLPAAPKDMALANGLAFVADGTGGLQIVNYRGFDTQGVAPTVSIVADAIDADPATPGVQVLEGRAVRVVPTVADDVQVRNVELLVNGQVVLTDVSFPWELFAQAPTIASGGTTMTVQVRATDTGGNVGLSNIVTLNIVPDTFAPQVTSISVEEGVQRFFVRSIDIVFDEPLDIARLNASGVHLVRSGTDGQFGTSDDVAIPVRLDTRNFGQSLSVVVDGFLSPGNYRFTLDAAVVADRAGNALAAPIVRNFNIRPASDVKAVSGLPEIPTAPSANPGQQIGIAVPFDPTTARAEFTVVDFGGTVTTRTVTAARTDPARGLAYFTVPFDAVTGDVVVYSQVGNTRTDFPDGTFPLQIVPVVTDVQVQFVSGTTAHVVLMGLGFVEGQNSAYQFGSETILDAGVNTGPQVGARFDGVGNFIPNGSVTIDVPVTAGAFGPITVKTGGGTSATYSVGLSGVTSTAVSGSPANAAVASANAGQAITLTGRGLTTDTDVLVQYVDSNGTPVVVSVSPTSAAADGTSATLIVPNAANGVTLLQVFGSATQPLLQIVPTLTGFDIGGFAVATTLFGSGLVEGASTYRFTGAEVTDSPADVNSTIDVGFFTADNGRVDLYPTALPTHGLGNVTVTTAGGTSTPLPLNAVRVTVEGINLGDVAVNAAGQVWVSDSASPGHLLRVDPAAGQVLQTITLTDDFGQPHTFNAVGLQILSAPMTLGSTAVPAGSLLVFNGTPNPDRIIAVNPATGAVLGTLDLATSYGLTGAAYDAASNRIYLTANSSNRIVAVSPTTGAELGTTTPPFDVQTWSGLAIDPGTGHLWLGAANGGPQLVEYQIGAGGALTELRRLDTSTQGLNQNEISGLSFGPDGALWAASIQGLLYKLNTAVDPASMRPATLSQVIASAQNGVPANGGQAAANVGQVIELAGTNFGAGTRVLFATRDNEGKTSFASIIPLAINAAGTRLQVRVPDLATTGDVRVVNQGFQDLTVNGLPDAAYRSVTLNFDAGSDTAVIRFSDGGLQGLTDESWGLDNVSVRQGGTTVFTDSFENGAKAAWSNRTVDGNAIAAFSRFSGRFSSASQTLTLTGLTAGQRYTLSFDLYVLDSWEGSDPFSGPDQIDVTVDGISLLRETLANSSPFATATNVQTFGASPGIRLQIVPTLSGLSGRPGSEDQFILQGSGFAEGATTITIGGRAVVDRATNLNPFDVSGVRNDTMTVVAPRTLDGPIRIATEGGYDEKPGPVFSAPTPTSFTSITASASIGVPADLSKPSAVTGQTIVLHGQGFTSDTLVQFEGVDDSGLLGKITVTGNAGANGTTLSVVVPALARTGAVTVLGSNNTIELQIVPTLRSLGGTVAAGNTLLLTGSGLTRNDLLVLVDGRPVGSFNVRTLMDRTSTSADQQLLQVVVPPGAANGVVTVSTAGGSSTLRTGAVIAANPTLTPATDVGETLATATDLALASDRRQEVISVVGTGTGFSDDVDLYRIDLTAGDVVTIAMTGSAITTRVRVFDAAGIELTTRSMSSTTAALTVTAPTSGSYYIGISGSSNAFYNPTVAGSGAFGTSGAYQLNVERLNVGTTRLTGMTASASSGTAANSAIASANTGQLITLRGNFVAGEVVVFSSINFSGTVQELSVTPRSLDLPNGSLTVVVPGGAVTGYVRLARDPSGLLLQIVPTLTNVEMSGGTTFTGGGLTLTGSGFAEGAITVLAGDQRIEDISRQHGLHVSGNSLFLTLPNGMPSGPIRVSTIGGTSAAFGLAITSITANATNGTAANTTQASANPGQVIRLNGSGLDATSDVVFHVVDANGVQSDLIVKPTNVNSTGTQAQVIVPLNAVTGTVRVVGDVNGAEVPLQIVPVVSDVQVQFVFGTTAQVVLTGLGFVEGHNSEYGFGSERILDAGVNTGPQVGARFDGAGNFIPNGSVTLDVPVTAGAFGPITVKTAGGTSATYSVDLSGITSTAVSGTPANAAVASANAGQAITLTGRGLTTDTDVLVQYVDNNGTPVVVSVSPTSAAADGTSATLIVPNAANGVSTLQLFGSTSQPVLQIVPTLTGFDLSGVTTLFGSGFVEGASTYRVGGVVVTDNPEDVNSTVDVGFNQTFTAENGRVDLAPSVLPTHGLGTVTVTTEGGTSTALSLNAVRVNVEGTSLGDVAVNAAGQLWVSDSTSPGHLLRVDPATGQLLQTITLTDDFGQPHTFNAVGLQILSAPMTLGSTAVPAGSLLVFNGNPNPDRVIAVNPATGAVLGTLDLAANDDLTGAAYDAASNRIYLTSNTSNTIVAVSATTGAELGTTPSPFDVQTWSGLAIDPATGHLWLGSANGGPQLVEYQIGGNGTLTELRRLDTSTQGLNQNEISGLSFAPDGALWVASTQGLLYRITIPSTLSRTAALSDASSLLLDAVPNKFTVDDPSASSDPALSPSLAYAQPSWVQDFVSGKSVEAGAEDEQLVITLPNK
ncbi:MAG: Ig-like domain-containing protein [Nitrospira sp.]